MREAEIATRDEKYEARKPISKEVIMFGYIIVVLLLIFVILTKNYLLLFLFVTAFSTIVNYQTNIPTIRFNPSPEVFSSLLLTRVMGFEYALFMLALPTLFVDVYTARLDMDTFISLILTIIISYIMSLTSNINFVFIGIVLVTIKFVIGLLINLAIEISPQEIIFEHVLGFVSNVIIFLAFGSLLFRLFS